LNKHSKHDKIKHKGVLERATKLSNYQVEAQHFVEDVGLIFERLGMSRIAGKILGWLLISNPPHQTMRDLEEALQVSKASISNNSRILAQMGIIERISLPGHRRDHYRIRSGAWLEITRWRANQIRQFRELAERGLNLLDGEEPTLSDRLQEMHTIYSFFEREFPPLMSRLEQLNSRQKGNGSKNV
jgi:DNA-binding transcriptional regulator GbsR (MarR family)